MLPWLTRESTQFLPSIEHSVFIPGRRQDSVSRHSHNRVSLPNLQYVLNKISYFLWSQCLVLWHWVQLRYPACSASIHHLDSNNTSAGENSLKELRNWWDGHLSGTLSSPKQRLTFFLARISSCSLMSDCACWYNQSVSFFFYFTCKATNAEMKAKQTDGALSSDPKQMGWVANTCDAYSQSCVNTKHRHLDTC